MVTTSRHITVAELERDGAPEGLWELINGELVEMPPAGGRHGRLGMRFGVRVGSYVEAHRLGHVYDAQTGFVISEDPPTVRVPDVAFVRTERLPANFDDGGFLRVIPDLVIEVISPSDRAVEVLAKVVMWLEAGVRAVWVADPVAETITVYTSDAAPRVLRSGDILDGGEILPGFSVLVRDIFAL